VVGGRPVHGARRVPSDRLTQAWGVETAAAATEGGSEQERLAPSLGRAQGHTTGGWTRRRGHAP